MYSGQQSTMLSPGSSELNNDVAASVVVGGPPPFPAPLALEIGIEIVVAEVHPRGQYTPGEKNPNT